MRNSWCVGALKDAPFVVHKFISISPSGSCCTLLHKYLPATENGQLIKLKTIAGFVRRAPIQRKVKKKKKKHCASVRRAPIYHSRSFSSLWTSCPSSQGKSCRATTVGGGQRGSGGLLTQLAASARGRPPTTSSSSAPSRWASLELWWLRVLRLLLRALPPPASRRARPCCATLGRDGSVPVLGADRVRRPGVVVQAGLAVQVPEGSGEPPTQGQAQLRQTAFFFFFLVSPFLLFLFLVLFLFFSFFCLSVFLSYFPSFFLSLLLPFFSFFSFCARCWGLTFTLARVLVSSTYR